MKKQQHLVSTSHPIYRSLMAFYGLGILNHGKKKIARMLTNDEDFDEAFLAHDDREDGNKQNDGSD